MKHVNLKRRARQVSEWLATVFPVGTRIACRMIDRSRRACGEQQEKQSDRVYLYQIESSFLTREIEVTELVLQTFQPAAITDEIRCSDALLAPAGYRIRIALEHGTLVSQLVPASHVPDRPAASFGRVSLYRPAAGREAGPRVVSRTDRTGS